MVAFRISRKVEFLERPASAFLMVSVWSKNRKIFRKEEKD
ncbi:hypothetical protein HMPREF3187_01233 [Aerococcus christensenii]|uniref:Uncharacterized protein n=1 Tax=Aerococcus christensenii TaxID=87541 RepID=A0A133XVD0_9LACT|nr:hypothetical protein HMPREF3187_01233 [Aerococcus christensenii]